MKAMALLFGAGVALSACSNSSQTANAVAQAASGLAAAEQLISVYAALPTCTTANEPLCSDASVVAKLHALEPVAEAAVSAAQASDNSATAAAAAAAVAALVAAIPATVAQ